MKYHGFLVRRYLKSRFVPIAAVGAVAFAVFALMSVLSVMEGFKHEMRDKIRGSLSHLNVFGEYKCSLYGDEILDRLAALDHVEAVAPYVQGMGLYRTQILDACTVRGIDPLAEARVGDFAHYLLRDDERELLLNDPTQSRRLPADRAPLSDEEIVEMFSFERRERIYRSVLNGNPKGFEIEEIPQPIVVGIEAMRHRRMIMGQQITISSYSPRTLQPRVQSFLVVGAFQSGLHEQDVGLVYMPLRTCQEFLDIYDPDPWINEYRYGGVSIRLDDYANADRVRTQIERELAHAFEGRTLIARTWEDERSTLLAAVDVEKNIIFYMMLLIVLFAGAMIWLILALMGIEKTRDLGVLQSLGATPWGVVTLFLRLGIILCVTGVVMGALAGWVFTSNINWIHDQITYWTGYRLFPPQVYYLTEIPVRIEPLDLAWTLGPAILFGFLGSLLPAIRASRRDPVKSLRYE